MGACWHQGEVVQSVFSTLNRILKCVFVSFSLAIRNAAVAIASWVLRFTLVVMTATCHMFLSSLNPEPYGGISLVLSSRCECW